MKLIVPTSRGPLAFNATSPRSISIPLSFGRQQVGAFGAPPASSQPCASRGIIGSVRDGGPCNFSTVTLTPHCSGTHTECVGHLVEEPISVRELRVPPFLLSALITLSPIRRGDTQEEHAFIEADDDPVITHQLLSSALDGASDQDIRAIVVRTVPNPESKKTQAYSASDIPPYFTLDAVRFLKSLGIENLCVDIPSLDRIEDGGALAAHRIWWDLQPGQTRLEADPPSRRTITELVYVPDDIPDGKYLLALQPIDWDGEAVPSRPQLFPLVKNPT